MATRLFTVFVEFAANSAKFRAETDKVRRDARRTGDQAGQSLRRIGAGVAAASLAGVAALSRLAQQAQAAALRTGDVAARLGVTVGALSELQGVARQSGLAVETLNQALQRTQRRVSEAAKGTGEAVGALQELNLDARALSQLPLDQQFDRIAAALQDVENAGDRTRLAFKLFDSEGVALLQTLDATGRTLIEQRQRVRELGGTITDEQIAVFREWRAASEDVAIATEGVGRELAEVLAPAAAEAARALADLLAGLDPVTAILDEARALAVDAAAALFEFAGGLSGAYAAALDFIGLDALAESQREIADGATAVAANLRDQAVAYRENAAATIENVEAQRQLLEVQAAQASLQADTAIDSPISTASTSAAGAAFSQQGRAAQEEQTQVLREEAAKRDALRAEEAERAAFYIEQERRGFEAAQRAKLASLQTYADLAIASAGLLFKNDKAVGIATAVVNTAVGVTKALSRNDFAAAALVAVRGAAQIAAIRRANVGGGGGAGGGGFQFRAPPSPILEPQAAAAPGSERGTVSIVFEGDVNGWDSYIEERVIGGIRDAVDNRDVTIFGRGSRQAIELQGAT